MPDELVFELKNFEEISVNELKAEMPGMRRFIPKMKSEHLVDFYQHVTYMTCSKCPEEALLWRQMQYIVNEELKERLCVN
jgi:hypothetical protein